MIRVDAVPDTAEVIKLIDPLSWPDHQRRIDQEVIDEAMGIDAVPFPPCLPVASGELATDPQPTTRIGIDNDL
jgi:hypothetical protein